MRRLVGWIYIVLGGGGLIWGLAICYILAGDTDPRAPDALGWMIAILAILSLVFLVPALIGGIGLVLGKEWGRIVAIAASVMLVLMFPIGTVLGAFALWALLARQNQPPRQA